MDDYGKDLLYALEKAKTHNTKADFIYVNQLKLSLLQEKRIDVLISNGLSAEWYYTLKGLGCVSIVFDVLDDFISLADIVIDHKANNQISNFGTSDFSLFDIRISILMRSLIWQKNSSGIQISLG